MPAGFDSPETENLDVLAPTYSVQALVIAEILIGIVN
jgi:hypothetical protein